MILPLATAEQKYWPLSTVSEILQVGVVATAGAGVRAGAGATGGAGAAVARAPFKPFGVAVGAAAPFGVMAPFALLKDS